MNYAVKHNYKMSLISMKHKLQDIICYEFTMSEHTYIPTYKLQTYKKNTYRYIYIYENVMINYY